jgi:uncharacterized protein (UPF0248 family)
MRTSHRRLLRIFHDPTCDFSKVRVQYIDRGAEGDASWVEGGEIARLDAEYFEVQSDRGIRPIPYHRILQIRYGGSVVWERGRKDDERPRVEQTGL